MKLINSIKYISPLKKALQHLHVADKEVKEDKNAKLMVKLLPKVILPEVSRTAKRILAGLVLNIFLR